MIRFPRGIQQTRIRLMSSYLYCGTGYRFTDSKTRKVLLELSVSVTPKSDGYAVIELFGAHHVLYNVTLSEELKSSGVSIEKLMEMAVNKISQETKSEARLFAVSSVMDIEHETDPDGTDVIVLWLQDTPIADLMLNEAMLEAGTEPDPGVIEVVTELKGPTVRFQLSQLLQHVFRSM